MLTSKREETLGCNTIEIVRMGSFTPMWGSKWGQSKNNGVFTLTPKCPDSDWPF